MIPIVFPVEDLLTYLEGRWSFTRQILGTSESGKMTGNATFSTLPDGLLYHERGLLKQGSYEGPFEQKYSLVFSGRDVKQAKVYRQEKTFFFLLDLSKGQQKVEYLCGEDHYLGTINSFDSSLKCQWQVKGPRKAYTLTSCFMKL